MVRRSHPSPAAALGRAALRQFSDLLGARFALGGRDPKTGIDCLGVVMEVLRRTRLAVPEEAFPLASYSDDVSAAIDWIGAGRQAAAWHKLGETVAAARLVGDVILSDEGVVSKLPHVSVVIFPIPPKLALTATRSRGVVSLRAERIRNVLGVYRLRGSP